ncbi:ankyrin repeat domain-containing protein [Marispirochaeta sp.]|uniref:ankyrin repeat domain-containing protein n=1 Tax=Marispirochaeta sp. TaxID=2038653 RepID=UPI0029C634F2|nr:ankyrin repeat domain-containing protein [Marispirochaeta sp.]
MHIVFKCNLLYGLLLLDSLKCHFRFECGVVALPHGTTIPLCSLEGESYTLKAPPEAVSFPGLIILVSSLTPEILQMLIDHGANVNLSGKNKASSPLHFWVHRGRYDIVKLLLKHGADVKAKNIENNTPIQIAKKIPDKKIREKMLSLLYKYIKK